MRTSSASSTNPQLPLLVIEDSNEDFEALQRFIQRSPIQVPIQRCTSGKQALDFLYHTGSYLEPPVSPRPGLIMLDLNLPGTDGREILRCIKQDEALKTIPVVVFTTSNNPKDIEECYQYGANSYIIKPINFAQLKQNLQVLVEYWFEVTTLPNYREK